jgi:hypothetical protein
MGVHIQWFGLALVTEILGGLAVAIVLLVVSTRSLPLLAVAAVLEMISIVGGPIADAVIGGIVLHGGDHDSWLRVHDAATLIAMAGRIGAWALVLVTAQRALRRRAS